ncbi:molybdopterin-dependent oxidoreductase [Halogeometricum limi]|uniref:Oxidoreductase molybdopterin binding domain-containing protein n=1 Tax=Halogeometricum limi TaxID=555875 RepID=A0A1I6G4D0_9EURY|nr:molybdopterin-dependent oxidoreductase [Halogeometricum limi]SFR37063.1 Oxidoreductase molybdopterin binding domain-containing protein [Halogeometricum limi]
MSARARELLAALEPPPRLVDWSILACVLFEAGSGVLSFGAGAPANWPLFELHALVGLTLVFLLFYKFRRVRRRVTDSRLWDRATGLSVLTATVAVAALFTGSWWVLGGNARVLGYWNLLNLHVGLGLVLLPLVLAHLYTRFRTPTRADFEGRRTALKYGTLLVGGALLLRVQELVNAALDTGGRVRRFTGSKPIENDGLAPEGDVGDGNASFPVTSWVADDPDPVDEETWRIRVGGDVDSPVQLAAADLTADADTERRVLLDCTSGWYAERDWRGVRLGDVLDAAGPTAEARWVTVHSVTGYRWSFPIEEAEEMLLATHVGGDRLSHGHGFPARLVAPDRRGFQWIKWVDGIEVRRRRDPAQWVAVLVSGFE